MKTPLSAQITTVLDQLVELHGFRTIDRVEEDVYDFDLTTNDYLDLCSFCQEETEEYIAQDPNPEVQAYLKALQCQDEVWGGATGSRLISGNHAQARCLEQNLGQRFSEVANAPFKCLLFNSGYHANVGIFPALAKLGKTMFLMDQLVHASIIDGVRLSGSPFQRFIHNDLENLELHLAKAVEKYDNIVIVVESVYSMDGDGPEDMFDLVTLKAKYEAQANIILFCDEAHAVGLFGRYGLGRCVEDEAASRFDVICCPLGKAVNAYGCLVFTNELLRNYLVNVCRTFIYSTALPPALVQAIDLNMLALATDDCAKQAKQLLAHSNELRQVIREAALARYARRFPKLEQMLDDMIVGDFQISGLILGSNDLVLRSREFFASHSVKVAAIRYPTVPRDTERLRFALQAGYSKDDFEELAEVFVEFVNSGIFAEALAGLAEQYED